MAMSLVASTRGLALMPEYANNLLPWSVVSRPLEGDAPTVDLVIGYSRSNTSPVLKLFLREQKNSRHRSLHDPHGEKTDVVPSCLRIRILPHRDAGRCPIFIR